MLGKFKLAARDFRQAAKMAPNDPDLRRKLSEAEKEVKRIRFEEALSVPARRCLYTQRRPDASKTSRWSSPAACKPKPVHPASARAQEAEVVPVSETIDLSSMPVPANHGGPRMAGALCAAMLALQLDHCTHVCA